MIHPGDAYYGLLTNPPGLYGLVDNGRTQAVTLTGSPQFRERAFNLFSSFGGESRRKSWVESRPPILRWSDRPDTAWFCMPRARIVTALTLFLYGQIWTVKAVRTNVVDEEGDLVEITCSNEDALMVEAAELANTFVANEMPTDYAAIPTNEWTTADVVEHGFGMIRADSGE